MPNIAQQDYIIIDWEGKDASDAAKKAEVDAILKNLFIANPLALLSVIFKNYGTTGSLQPISGGLFFDDEVVSFALGDSTLAPEEYAFSIS